jgi:membrane associated rhomboid family serine protease
MNINSKNFGLKWRYQSAKNLQPMSELTQKFKTQATILGGLVGTMWAVMIVNTVLDGQLDQFGIAPHDMVGLRGILFAPFLHGDFGHLISNTMPFIVLGWLVMLAETTDILVVTGLSMLIGGVGTWLFGSVGTNHIGASGVVFGFLGYLLMRGYFDRKISSILISLFVFSIYGTVLFGILPGKAGISWEGHLFGFLGGVLTARLSAPESVKTSYK